MTERNNRNKLYLDVMIEASDSIIRFMGEVNRADFTTDELRQSAVIQKLSVIGTAATRVQFLQKKHHEVNWRNVVKFSRIGLHQYFSKVDVSLLWTTATKDIPELREKLLAIQKLENL